MTSTVGLINPDAPAFQPGNIAEIILGAENRIDLSGSLVSASTTGPINAGNVIIQGSFSDPHIAVSLVDSQITSTSEGGAGNAGSIELGFSATYDLASLSLSGASEISTSATGSGNAGAIEVWTNSLSMTGGSQITSTAGSGSGVAGAAAAAAGVGTGDAGSVSIHVSGDALLEMSKVLTQADLGAGGDITFDVGGYLRLNESEVSTSVLGVSGDGGNIALSSDLMVLRSSKVTADAVSGNGGAVSITANRFFKTPDTQIHAVSELSEDGVVEMNTPEVNDIESSLVSLPTDLLSAADMFQPTCLARAVEEDEGSFVVARRVGRPASPEGLLIDFDVMGGGGATIVAEIEGELPAVASATQPVESSDQVLLAMNEIDAGARAFRGGHFEQASEHWEEASELYLEEQDETARADALRGLAQSQQALGKFEQSLVTLRGALAAAEKSGDQARIASVLGSLGNTHLALGRGDSAEQLLARGIKIAAAAGEHQLAAGMLNNLGNYHAAQQSFGDAVEYYLQGARLARANGYKLQQTKALANAARAALSDDRHALAVQLVNDAYTHAQLLPDNNQKVYLLIHAAKTYEQLAQAAEDRRARHLLNAHSALSAAVKLASGMGDRRALSYAYGNLGALYLSENRTREALFLTRKAMRTADAAEAPESLYRWYWQEGKIHWAQGHASQAISAYERAVAILEETRQESKSHYGSSEAYFRKSVAPVYMDLVEALLEGSELPGDRQQAMSLLLDARQTVEKFKAAELRDYFRDQCVAEVETSERHLDEVAADAAVIYPILFADRMELLVKLPSGIERYTLPVGEAEIREQSLRLRVALQDPHGDQYLETSQLLYRWLVAPYAAELEKQRVQTLVFVPDGALRTIPMAALHDGESFLAARYALALAPSLGLIEPKAFDPDHTRLLLAGVSEAVQGFPALSFVRNELNAVQELYGGDLLLDSDFNVDSIESAMASVKPSVVHLASHAVFSGEASSSFLLTHDGRMDMDHLAAMIGKARLRDEPVELLMLSACETAAGDDRAALGLAGVAIRAGARSAVGSLWNISDEATYELVVEFYKQLGDTSQNKAQALSKAQAKLRESDKFSHPYYWSPFLMINNWL